MKLIRLFPVVLLVFLYNTVFSQSIKWSFFNYSHIATENGNIIVSPISPTPFKINVNFLRPSIEPWLSLPIKGELVLYYEENGQYPLFTTTFTTSDWENGAVLSKTIIRDAVFSHGLLSDSRRSIDVYVKYRYYKDKYPYPENTDGWTEWYTIPSKTVFMLSNSTLPASIISGPSQVCNEETYTITNPYVISLENAAGIATLTDLGLNKWKVTRIGTATGTVILRSHSSTNVKFEKTIDIGTVARGSIMGNSALQLGESQTYTLSLNENTDYKWSVSYNPNITWTKLSPTSIKLSTTGIVPMGWSENVTISAQAIGSCGLSSNFVSKTIKFVNEREPRLD